MNRKIVTLAGLFMVMVVSLSACSGGGADDSGLSATSLLVETMDLTEDQEAAMLDAFTACGIGEITSVSVVQAGRERTSYHLRDEETAYYKDPIVVYINNTNKAVEDIYYGNSYGDFDIYLDGAVVSNIKNYYVTQAERDKYTPEAATLAGDAVNKTDEAMLDETWSYDKDEGNIIVTCEKYDFQVIFDANGQKTSVTYHGYELLE